MNICECCAEYMEQALLYDCLASCSCLVHMTWSLLAMFVYMCSAALLPGLVLTFRHQSLVPLQEMPVGDQGRHPGTGRQHSEPYPWLLACVFC